MTNPVYVTSNKDDNVKYTNTLRPGSTMTIRRLQSETSSS